MEEQKKRRGRPPGKAKTDVAKSVEPTEKPKRGRPPKPPGERVVEKRAKAAKEGKGLLREKNQGAKAERKKKAGAAGGLLREKDVLPSVSSKKVGKSTTVSGPKRVRKVFANIWENLWPHNRRAVQFALDAFSVNNPAMIVQPTGSGKTGVAFGVVERLDNQLDHVVVVQPYTSIEHGHKESPFWKDEWASKVSYITYSKLAMMVESTDEQLKEAGLLGIDLIIFDEAHHIHATVWRKGYQHVLERNPKCRVLGLTATPIRYLDDQFDVAETYFGGVSYESLTLVDAIKEEVFQRPFYVADHFDFEGKIERYRSLIRSSSYPKRYKQSLTALVDRAEKARRSGPSIPEKIKAYMNECIPDVTNPKFIVFSPTLEKLQEYKSVVSQWFKDAGYAKVRVFEVHSKSGKAQGTVFQTFEEKRTGSVDLLFAVDKLNEGVHLNSVCGLIMLRTTESPIVFYQQLGRAFYAGMKNRPLVFDYVNNHDSISVLKNALVPEGEESTSVQIDSINNRGIDYSTVTMYDHFVDFGDLDERLAVEYVEPHSVWLSGSEKAWDLFDRFLEKSGRLPHRKDNVQLYMWFRNQVELARAGDDTRRNELALRGVGF